MARPPLRRWPPARDSSDLRFMQGGEGGRVLDARHGFNSYGKCEGWLALHPALLSTSWAHRKFGPVLV